MGFYSTYSGIKILTGILCLLLFANCTPLTRQPKLIIDGMVFQNQTRATIQNVQVQVKKTSAFAECSPVLANNECTTTFQAITYQGNPITISWEQNGRINRTKEFHASLPELVIPDKHAKLLVIINRAGAASANLIQ